MSNNTAENIVLDSLPPQIPLDPPLKWAGGKRWLVPRLAEMYSNHRNRRLVEPFAGGLAVALGLDPQKALLNDVNAHLIFFYQNLKRGLKTGFEMKHEREFFFKARTRFNHLAFVNESHTEEASALFYYLNRTCFNGLCRFNGKGEFNVPFGQYKKIRYRDDFTEYKEAFQNWDFTCLDFEELEIDGNDFIYVDPPYDVEFTKYSKDDFKWEDQQRLVNWLTKLPNPIVASNQATDRILELYTKAGFEIEILSAPRRISCTGDRKPAGEILAWKNFR